MMSERAQVETMLARLVAAEAAVEAVRALLTSGPIGRESGERYIRADLIRDALDAPSVSQLPTDEAP